MNSSMLSKQVWRLLQEPNSYLASTIKTIYYPNSDLRQARIGRDASWVWRSLIHGRSLIMQEARWEIGPGQTVNIVDDNWLASGAKATLLPSASFSKVGDLINSSHEWDLEKLRNNLLPSSAIEALKTLISWSATSNQLMWPHTKEGAFSIKSGYIWFYHLFLISDSMHPLLICIPLISGILFGTLMSPPR